MEASDYNSALLCYICAGDVERMTACWAKSDGENASPIMLQNLIEKMMVLKKSVENDQQPIVSADSHVAAQLSNYASLLSSQGNLQTALVYLSVVDGEGVAVLKDRVYRAHGGSGQSPFKKVDVPTKAPTSIPRSPMQEQTPSLTYKQPAATPPATFQPPQPQPPVQPPQPEPTPQPYYNPADNTSYYNPAQQPPQPQPQPIPGVFTPGAPPTNHYQPQQPQPPQPQHFQPPPPSSRTPTGPPPPGQIYQPPAPAPAAAPPTAMFTPGPPPQPAGMFTPGPPPSANGPPPGDGLNSPMKPSAAPPPTMGPPPSGGGSIMSMKAAKDENKPAPQPMNFYNPAAVMQQPHPNNMQPDMNAQNGMPPSHGVPNMPNSTALPPQQTQLPPQPKKEVAPVKAEVIKAPIPQEHIVLQQIFDALVEKCRGATRNPQSKRKLDDVTRKLDALYDLLRENGISPNVLASLHRMSQACQQSDYPTGIQLHTQLISTGNFSEISSFMPGLKTLMQISQQLKV